MDALQRYELISPILKHKKTAKQVHQEINVPPGTIHGYLKRLVKGVSVSKVSQINPARVVLNK